MNVRERFNEVMDFNTQVPSPKWEFGYWDENYKNWCQEGLPLKAHPGIPDPPGTHIDLHGPCWRSIQGDLLSLVGYVRAHGR